MKSPWTKATHLHNWMTDTEQEHYYLHLHTIGGNRFNIGAV